MAGAGPTDAVSTPSTAGLSQVTRIGLMHALAASGGAYDDVLEGNLSAAVTAQRPVTLLGGHDLPRLLVQTRADGRSGRRHVDRWQVPMTVAVSLGITATMTWIMTWIMT